MKQKKSNNNKLVSIIVAVFLFIAFIIGGPDLVDKILNSVSTSEVVTIADNNNPKLSNELRVHYIDVGQGDSILIQNENAAILIDGGTRQSANELVKYIKSQGVNTLNYVIATHPHEDHIGGLDDAINNFEVEHVMMPKKSASTKVFSDLASAIKSKNLKAEAPEVGKSIKLADMKLTTLAPINDNYEEVNDFSIVLKLDYKNTSFLFTGDSEKIAEADILSTNANLKSDVLKVGHHGSSTSTSELFLNKVNPKYAILSLGKDNTYGHPHKETLEALNKNNSIVYRTDRNGTITAISNGNNISFQVQKGYENGYTDTDKKTDFK